jgi:hypothetical protein
MVACTADLVPDSPVGGEGTFILTELGTSGCVHCVTSIQLQVAPSSSTQIKVSRIMPGVIRNMLKNTVLNVRYTPHSI